LTPKLNTPLEHIRRFSDKSILPQPFPTLYKNVGNKKIVLTAKSTK